MKDYGDLYYIPEEDMEETVRYLKSRNMLGTIQVVIGVILAILFGCTDVSNYDIPWSYLITSGILLFNGIRLLNKVSKICSEYDLHIG